MSEKSIEDDIAEDIIEKMKQMTNYADVINFFIRLSYEKMSLPPVIKYIKNKRKYLINNKKFHYKVIITEKYAILSLDTFFFSFFDNLNGYGFMNLGKEKQKLIIDFIGTEHFLNINFGFFTELNYKNKLKLVDILNPEQYKAMVLNLKKCEVLDFFDASEFKGNLLCYLSKENANYLCEHLEKKNCNEELFNILIGTNIDYMKSLFSNSLSLKQKIEFIRFLTKKKQTKTIPFMLNKIPEDQISTFLPLVNSMQNFEFVGYIFDENQTKAIDILNNSTEDNIQFFFSILSHIQKIKLIGFLVENNQTKIIVAILNKIHENRIYTFLPLLNSIQEIKLIDFLVENNQTKTIVDILNKIPEDKIYTFLSLLDKGLTKICDLVKIFDKENLIEGLLIIFNNLPDNEARILFNLVSFENQKYIITPFIMSSENILNSDFFDSLNLIHKRFAIQASCCNSIHEFSPSLQAYIFLSLLKEKGESINIEDDTCVNLSEVGNIKFSDIDPSAKALIYIAINHDKRYFMYLVERERFNDILHTEIVNDISVITPELIKNDPYLNALINNIPDNCSIDFNSLGKYKIKIINEKKVEVEIPLSQEFVISFINTFKHSKNDLISKFIELINKSNSKPCYNFYINFKPNQKPPLPKSSSKLLFSLSNTNSPLFHTLYNNSKYNPKLTRQRSGSLHFKQQLEKYNTNFPNNKKCPLPHITTKPKQQTNSSSSSYSEPELIPLENSDGMEI